MREATRLFAEHGYGATSTAAIVAAAGVTKPMLYYYFRDKQGLFDAIMDAAFDRLDQGLRAIAARGLSASAELGEIAELRCQMARTDQHLARFGLVATFGPRRDRPRGDMERLGMRLFQALFLAASRGIETGELAGDPTELAMAVMGVTELHIMGQLARPEMTLLPPGKGHQIVALLLRGLRV